MVYYDVIIFEKWLLSIPKVEIQNFKKIEF